MSCRDMIRASLLLGAMLWAAPAGAQELKPDAGAAGAPTASEAGPAAVAGASPDAGHARGVVLPEAGILLGSPGPDGGSSGAGTQDSGAGRSSDLGGDAGKRELPDWAPKLTATVKPAVANLGDPVTVTIKVRHRPGVSVNLPLKLELGKFTELSRDETSRKLGRKGEIPETERTFQLQVAAYELGEQTLPSIDVTALGPRGELVSLSTTALPILIKSVMSNEPKPKLKDIEPTVSVFQRTYWLLYLLMGIAGVGLVVAVTLLVSRHIRRKQAQALPPPPPRPAHEVALERLNALDLEGLIQQELYKELYLALSEIIRGYVGGNWRFDAMEMTTTEINQALHRRQAGREIQARLERFFNDCDLVKFAKFRPDAETARITYGAAVSIVRDTSGFGEDSLGVPGYWLESEGDTGARANPLKINPIQPGSIPGTPKLPVREGGQKINPGEGSLVLSTPDSVEQGSGQAGNPGQQGQQQGTVPSTPEPPVREGGQKINPGEGSLANQPSEITGINGQAPEVESQQQGSVPSTPDPGVQDSERKINPGESSSAHQAYEITGISGKAPVPPREGE